MNRGAFGGATLIESFAGENGSSPNSISPGSSPKEDHFVARTFGVGEVEVFVPENSHRQGVHQGVVLVNRVKPRFTTNVGQA